MYGRPMRHPLPAHGIGRVLHEILLVSLALILGGCNGCSCGRSHRVAVARQGEDAFDIVYHAKFQADSVTDRGSTPLPRDAYSGPWFAKPAHDATIPASTPADKIHPTLLAALDTLPPEQELELLVTFKDRVRIPPMPQMPVQKSGPQTTGMWRPAAASGLDSMSVKRSQAIVESVYRLRAGTYAAESAVLTQQFQAQVMSKFWITNALTVEMKAKFVKSVASLPDVRFIRRTREGERPPTCASTATPCGARNAMHSDVYVDAGLGSGLIALLDTGVPNNLTSLAGRVTGMFDCVDGDTSCAVGNLSPEDFCSPGHGTSSAAILTGHPSPPNDYTGVTEASVMSFQVFAPAFDGSGCFAELDAPAVLRAFEQAKIRRATVILAEIDALGSRDGEIAVAAEQAFQSGTVVIAANGDTGGPAGSPAIARCVIGTGAYSLSNGAAIPGWSGGTTGDGRMKPDLLEPTDTWTEGMAGYRQFSGTSGAAPYAAGAALLAHNLLIGSGTHLDPGQVNSFLILSGRRRVPVPNQGVGKVVLPTDCWVFWGKVQLNNADTVTVPIAATGLSGDSLEAAIWWPEFSPQNGGLGRNHIDLSILDPNGNVQAVSAATNTVFQRTACHMPNLTGDWSIKLVGTNVPKAPQDVYLTVAVRLPPQSSSGVPGLDGIPPHP